MTTPREEVYAAVDAERTFQDSKWGVGKQQSLAGFITIMRKELEEAELAWLKNKSGKRQTPLEEIVQVVATGIACLEKYGVEGTTFSTDDLV